MARASTVTLIPIDRVASILQIDPLHFNGVTSQRRPLRNACDDVWFQHDYQSTGRISRESLALALYEAEMTVASYLGFPRLPMWFVDEEHPIQRAMRPESVSIGSFNVRGDKKSVRSVWGYVTDLGVRATATIQLLAAVVYNDSDGDGYKETATVVVPTTITNPQEISVFYPGKSADQSWEIRPVDIVISGGNATLTFRREQAVLESHLELLNDTADRPPTVDGDDDLNFLNTVDVYRVYTDHSTQATFVTENDSAGCDESSEGCGTTEESGCLTVRNARLGLLAYDRADWDSVNSRFTAAAFGDREPQKIKISYRAGGMNKSLKYPYRQMDANWERLIVYYAFTLLDTEVTGCENTKRVVSHMRQDKAKSVPNVETWNLSRHDLDCPIGTTRAALQLYRLIETDRLVTAR
jgi:hypothetical protein